MLLITEPKCTNPDQIIVKSPSEDKHRIVNHSCKRL